MKEILKIVFVIIGTIIGAGFASGKEIYIFFNKFGIAGLFGIIFSSIFTGIIIYKLIINIKEKNIKNYNELLNELNKKHPKINKLINYIVNSFLLISYFIMIACFSAFINQIFNIPVYISSIFFCFLCVLIFLKNIQGIIKTNEILIPVLILLIIYLGIKNVPYIINYNIQELINIEHSGWLFKAFLYVSYNSIILIPIITNLNIEKINKKQIKLISIFSSIFIIILAIIIFSLLLRSNNYTYNLELPLVEISAQFGVVFKYLYEIIIIISIFTSSIGAGYSFLKNVSKSKKQYIIYLILINITGIMVSNIGFSKLVEYLYPLFGLLGIFQIILILK